MAEKIFVSFTGWCECDPDKVEFVYLGMDKNVKEYITGREWLELQEEVSEGASVPCRDDYTIMSCADAQATALDGAYEDVFVEVE